MTYNDEILRDFLNGELPEAKSREIEAAMNADEDLQRRVMSLDPIAPIVRESLSGFPIAEKTQPLVDLIEATEKTQPSAWRMPLSLAASLALGLFIGSSFLAPEPAQGWRMEVARYQALYVNDTIAYANTTPAELTAQFSRASKALGTQLKAETFQSISGLKLKRAQVLGIKGDPLIQIVFEAANGDPIALCLTKHGRPAEGTEVLQGLASQSWSNDGVNFILIGGTETDQIASLAASVQSVL